MTKERSQPAPVDFVQKSGDFGVDTPIGQHDDKIALAQLLQVVGERRRPELVRLTASNPKRMSWMTR